MPQNTADFAYDLPPELIAQQPPEQRGTSRMLVLNRSDGAVAHHAVSDLPAFLRSGDVLVVNNTRVIPSRLFGQRPGTGGRIEVMLVEEIGAGVWDAYYKASHSPRAGARFELADGEISAEIVAVHGGGRVHLRLSCRRALPELLEQYGLPPLPPYIQRVPTGDAGQRSRDLERYQTVYAAQPGAVAAPTAGLHFSPGLLQALEAAGVRRVALTLHVGPGTFKPVKTEQVADHTVEAERYELPAAAAGTINQARAAGGRVVAVGSTVVRTLETVWQRHGCLRADSGRSALFIYPPFDFKAVDLMLTNFHLPQSSLLMMVCALAGHEQVMNAYGEAVRQRYRFYSYGDCMLII